MITKDKVTENIRENARFCRLRSCFDFMNCRIEMDFRGMFARLLRSIAGYVTKKTGEYNRKDTQDGRYKRQVL